MVLRFQFFKNICGHVPTCAIVSARKDKNVYLNVFLLSSFKPLLCISSFAEAGPITSFLNLIKGSCV